VEGVKEAKVLVKCVGCDKEIDMAPQSLLCYTCPCGSIVFYREDMGVFTFFLPCSLIMAVATGSPIAHLHCLVGESSYTSEVKERLIAQLRERGSISIEECEQCKTDGTLDKKIERDKALAIEEASKLTGGKSGRK